MEIPLADKIAADLACNGFSGTVNFSENGEATLNPYSVDIMRRFREHLPRSEFTLFTNMASMGEGVAAGLLASGLNRVTVCIDGATSETYRYMKGLDLNKVRGNLRRFIELRNRTRSDCRLCIYVISSYNYHTHVLRSNSPFPDDTQGVVEYWAPLLAEGDFVGRSPLFGFWAVPPSERPVNRGRCQSLGVIASKMLISSSGSAYLCCVDDNNRTACGDLNVQSITDVWNGTAHHDQLKAVLLRDYAKIGEPCLHCMPDARIN